MLDKKKIIKMFVNKKAYHNFFIKEIFYAGLILEGWEVKSIRAKKVNIFESYVIYYNQDMYLLNCIIQPLYMSSNHVFCDSTRKRKLLLNKREINYLSIKVKQPGYTLIPLSFFWKKSWCKLEFGLAKGKNVQDKRMDDKKNEWKKEKLRILKKTRSLV